jgi:hypothetical protein
VPYAEFGDPQSLNLYGYIENRPIAKFDRDGHKGELAFLKQELAGVWDATGGFVVHTTKQLASGEAAANFSAAYLGGNAVKNLGAGLQEMGQQIVDTGKAAASGDPRAIGQIAGTIIAGKRSRPLWPEAEQPWKEACRKRTLRHGRWATI